MKKREFEELIQDNLEVLQTMARTYYLHWTSSLGKELEWEDIFQDLIYRLLKKSKSFDRERGSFEAWASVVLRNLVLDHVRRKSARREDAVEGVDELVAAKETEPIEDMEEEERRELISLCLSRLTDDQRFVIERIFELEWSTSEVAEALGRTVNAVYQLQHRALKSLAECIETGGGT